MYCYVNGEFVEAERALVSAFDPGFTTGEGIFDVWRTYGHNLVGGVVERHLRRLGKGMRFLGVYDHRLLVEIEEATSELVKRNASLVSDGGDLRFWCGVTAGRRGLGEASSLATLVITTTEVGFSSYFRTNLYETGAELVPSLAVKNPWGAVDPRIKSISRLSLAPAEAKLAADPGNQWALLFDADGYITEAGGASLALIKDGEIIHAPREKILGGISLSMFCDFGAELGAKTREQNLTVYDFLDADEVWVMSSSIAAVPVLSLGGTPLTQNTTIGQEILDKWIDFVGFDFRAQAIEYWQEHH